MAPVAVVFFPWCSRSQDRCNYRVIVCSQCSCSHSLFQSHDLIQVFNKVAGVYGLIALATGAGGSFSQFSLYLYSLFALFALFYGLKAVGQVCMSVLWLFFCTRLTASSYCSGGSKEHAILCTFLLRRPCFLHCLDSLFRCRVVVPDTS